MIPACSQGVDACPWLTDMMQYMFEAGRKVHPYKTAWKGGRGSIITSGMQGRVDARGKHLDLD